MTEGGDRRDERRWNKSMRAHPSLDGGEDPVVLPIHRPHYGRIELHLGLYVFLVGDGVWSSSSWSVRLIDDKVKVVLEAFAKFESGTDWSRGRAPTSSGRQTDVDIDVRRHVYEHVQIFCPKRTSDHW